MQNMPRLYSQRMVFILTPFGREDKTLRVSFSLELITMLRADNPMVGQERIELTRPCERTGFTDRGAYLNALLTHM